MPNSIRTKTVNQSQYHYGTSVGLSAKLPLSVSYDSYRSNNSQDKNKPENSNELGPIEEDTMNSSFTRPIGTAPNVDIVRPVIKNNVDTRNINQ